MNRQARFSGESDKAWRDMGAVTIEEAAKMQMLCSPLDRNVVQVRDSDNPETIYTLNVEQVTDYRITNMRGGE